MKILKVLLLVLSLTILVSCESDPEDIVFDSRVFEYIGVTDDDYLLFRSGNSNLELLLEEDGTLRASYEKYQDIYLIIGEKDNYQIRENGILISVCTGEEAVCSGFLPVDFSDEVDVLFEVFEDEPISIGLIITGVLVITAAVSLFFIPKRYFEKIKIKDIKFGKLLILRVVTILMIIIGVTIIILSL